MDGQEHLAGTAASDAAVVSYLLFCYSQVRALLLQGDLPLEDAINLCRGLRDFFRGHFPPGEDSLGAALFDAVFAPDLRDMIQVVYD